MDEQLPYISMPYVYTDLANLCKWNRSLIAAAPIYNRCRLHNVVIIVKLKPQYMYIYIYVTKSCTIMQVWKWYSTTICKFYLTWFRLSSNQIVGFLIGSGPKPCKVPAPTTLKPPHASGHFFRKPSRPCDQNKHASRRNFRCLLNYKWVISSSSMAPPVQVSIGT